MHTVILGTSGTKSEQIRIASPVHAWRTSSDCALALPAPANKRLAGNASQPARYRIRSIIYSLGSAWASFTPHPRASSGKVETGFPEDSVNKAFHGDNAGWPCEGANHPKALEHGPERPIRRRCRCDTRGGLVATPRGQISAHIPAQKRESRLERRNKAGPLASTRMQELLISAGDAMKDHAHPSRHYRRRSGRVIARSAPAQTRYR